MKVIITNEERTEASILEGDFVLAIAGKNGSEESESVFMGKTSTNHLSRVGADGLVNGCKSISIIDSENCELQILSSAIERLKRRFNEISEKKGFRYEDIEKL